MTKQMAIVITVPDDTDPSALLDEFTFFLEEHYGDDLTYNMDVTVIDHYEE